MRADASTMRIFLTCNYSPWSAYSGGGQRSTHYLGSALAGRGHDVTVVFTKTPWDRVEPPSSLPYRLRWAVLPDYKSHISAPLRVLTAWTVASVIRRELTPGETAVVHAQGEEAARLPRERAHRRFGLVVTPRYPSLPRLLFAAPRSLVRTIGLLSGYGKYAALGVALRGADVCAPPSRYGGELIQRAYGVPPDRIHPVHNGVPRSSSTSSGSRCRGGTAGPRSSLADSIAPRGSRRSCWRSASWVTGPHASGSSGEARTAVPSLAGATGSG